MAPKSVLLSIGILRGISAFLDVLCDFLEGTQEEVIYIQRGPVCRGCSDVEDDGAREAVN